MPIGAHVARTSALTALLRRLQNNWELKRESHLKMSLRISVIIPRFFHRSRSPCKMITNFPGIKLV